MAAGTAFDAIARHPAFVGLAAADVEQVAAGCENLHLPAGGVLFAEGEESLYLYVVLQGRLRVTCRAASGVEVVVGESQGGEVVGEMGVIDGAPRAATLTAIGPVEVLQMRGEFLTGLVNGGHPAAAALLRVVRRQLVARIRETDERVDAVFESCARGGR